VIFSENSGSTNGFVNSGVEGARPLESNLLIERSTDSLVRSGSPSQMLRFEAEEMALSNYRLETVDFASGGLVASFWGGPKKETGSAAITFSGPDGLYDIVLGYFDEEGGGASLDPLLNGRSLGKLKLDQKLGSNRATAKTFVRRVVGNYLSLRNGDIFKVIGTEEANEHARIDYVEFIKLANPADTGNDSSNNNVNGPAALNSGATVRYISPNGKGNGSSWQQAASISSLDALIGRSAPGDEIWIAGDLGSYNVSGQVITLDSGGSATKPIYIRGVASRAGGNDTPLFVGSRAESWSPGKADGSEVFRLLEGANYLNFRNLNFKNIGNGAFQFGGDLTGITLEDMQASNVRRFVENFAAKGLRSASVNNLTIRDVKVHGFSKSAIRLQYNSQNVLIEDVLGDSQRQDGDNFAMGVHLSGTVHNVVHRRVTMNNAIQVKGQSDYWNADGFVTDWGTYNITYEDTYAAGNTDGGYDLKSNNTTLIRAAAADNKRNFRIWRAATMYNVVSDEPYRRGGIGTAAHIHVLGNEGNLSIYGGLFSGNRGTDNIVFDLDDRGSAKVEDAVITDSLYTLQTVEKGRLQFTNPIRR
jgi:hypothetical protein